MVLSTKQTRDLIKTSGLAKKKAKSSYKGHKKDNYKKKKEKKIEECCICYEKVEVCKDNTITCKKTDHTICRDCKVKMKGEDCPMCRSHPVKQPVEQVVKIKILQKPRKPNTNCSGMPPTTPKEKRNYHRKHIYDETFGHNTNRLVRQRSNKTGRLHQSGLNRYTSDGRYDAENGWLTEEQVLRYNGSMRTEYDSASDTSEDSDDISLTSGVTETSVGSIQAIVNEWIRQDEEERNENAI